MNLLFEESGDFKTGSVLTQIGEAYQVELPGGKRTKVRSRDVLLQYTAHDPAQLMSNAHEIAKEIDVDFLWEVAGEEEFGFAELGAEYFGHAPKPEEAAGLLIRLHAAPMYFYKKSKGRYKAAPEKSLKAALASIEKKRQQAIIQQQYVEQLKEGVFPEAVKPLAVQLICKPDKNSIEYKALLQACTELQTTPERLMVDTGAIASAMQLHKSVFLFEHFPKGTDFPALPLPPFTSDLPVADVNAFSIDDAATTEIDDAFSVSRLPDGNVKIGIHIAAPALGTMPGDVIDQIARQRMSTVYMPGEKITMLPDSYVQIFTLGVGEKRPAVSLYATINPEDSTLLATETKVELIKINVNLRHNDLEDSVTEDNLAQGLGEYPHKEDIRILWDWIQSLEKIRMSKREGFGLKSRQTNRPDYNFYIEDEKVIIEQRQRTAPLDRIVSELMIFVNSTWGLLMHEHGVPGIYRSQGEGNGHWASRRLVKIQTHAAPHQGLGVDQYTWSTSPLRRYTDLVNQWQILACVNHGVAAPLSAPYRHKDADLFAVISAFESAHIAYSEFQAKMERYWCLRWLSQNNICQAEAVVIRDETVQLVDIPLVIPLSAARSMERGTSLTIELLKWDEIDLSVEARLLHAPTAIADSVILESEDDFEAAE